MWTTTRMWPTPTYPWFPVGSFQSTSSSGSMSSGSGDQVELPVWLGGCEKWVTGLTRRTTCDDVLYALLAHNSNPNQEPDIQAFAIHERWRDVERPLRGRTKILKVWRAWGTERHKVKFYVRKLAGDSLLDTSCEVSRAKKVHHRRQSVRADRERRCRERKTRQAPVPPPPAADPATDEYKATAFHAMVQTIIEQEKKIQEQLNRIRETDVQIETYETKMHLLRIKENGLNYVQEAYLKERADESGSGSEELFPAIKANDLETYSRICDNILELEERLALETSRIHDLSIRIHSESALEAPSFANAQFSTPEKEGATYLPNASCSTIGSNDANATLTEANTTLNEANLTLTSEGDLDTQASLIAQEMDRSYNLSKAQSRQIQLVNETLDECEKEIQRKRTLIHSLLLELSTIDEIDTREEDGGGEEGLGSAEEEEWDDNPTVDLIEPPLVLDQPRSPQSGPAREESNIRATPMKDFHSQNHAVSQQSMLVEYPPEALRYESEYPMECQKTKLESQRSVSEYASERRRSVQASELASECQRSVSAYPSDSRRSELDYRSESRRSDTDYRSGSERCETDYRSESRRSELDYRSESRRSAQDYPSDPRGCTPTSSNVPQDIALSATPRPSCHPRDSDRTSQYLDCQRPVTITTNLEPLHSILRNKEGSRSESVSSRDSGHGSPDSVKDSGTYVHFDLNPPQSFLPPRPPPRTFDPRRMSMPDMSLLPERLDRLQARYGCYDDGTRVTRDLEFYVTRAYAYRDLNIQKTATDNDSNSDTGLSSLHSDEPPTVLETLV